MKLFSNEVLVNVSKRHNGNLSYKFGSKQEVSLNREVFFNSINENINNYVAMKTVHGVGVVPVKIKDSGRGMFNLEDRVEADALITNEKEVGLFLLVADCAPIIFYNKEKSLICLAHVNGKNPEIINNILKTCQSKYGIAPESLTVWVGPSIQKDSFVVPDPFQKKMNDWSNYIKDIPDGRTSIDMLGYLRNRMVSQGIVEANIYIDETDTYKSKEYFSHRRSVVTGEREGRFAVVARMI